MAISGKHKAAPAKQEQVRTYRGIELQPPAAPSQFTREQIRKAVENAIAKNAEAIAQIR